MKEQTLLQRRTRTQAIVEGALLGDIAIVFLLMRVYLPILILRTIIRWIAAVPFVLLTQRRGVRITILAAIASYILFSALVGPILALAAVDVAVAGILIGLGRNAGFGVGLNTIWTSPVYGFLDVVIPTVASVYIFRLPVKALIQTAKQFVRQAFNILQWFLQQLHAPASVIHQVHGWEQPAVVHWQLVWLGTAVLYGLSTMWLVALISDMVLKQMPEEAVAPQRATE
jgi:hypothetical protein